VADITDGTVNTLGIGQIHDHFGPWIAAGTSTARHVYHPTEKSPEPTFGSRFGTACYFATCDAAVHFFDMAKVSPEVLHNLAMRADGNPAPAEDYGTASEWKEKQKQ
jgi:hypothetical protein